MSKMSYNFCHLFLAEVTWLGVLDEFFPQLLSFELDTSASDDLLSDPLSNSTVDSTLVLLHRYSCCLVLTTSHCWHFSYCAQCS